MSLGLLKKLSTAAAILVGVWLVYMYRQVPHQKAPFAKADQAERLELVQGTHALALRHESGHWKVGQGDTLFYAADEELVKSLITNLTNLQIEDEITDRSDRAAEYDVTAEKGLRLRLADGKGTVLSEAILGKQAPDMSHIYFRYPDKPNVYLARGLYRGDLGHVEVNYWRNHQLIDIPETKIQSILIEGKGFKTEIVKVSTEAWTLNGKPIDSAAVDPLVGALAHLRAEDFIDTLSDKLIFGTVTVKGTDASVTLRIGAQDPRTKRYPVSVGKDQGLVWVSEPSAKAILKKPSDFKN